MQVAEYPSVVFDGDMLRLDYTDGEYTVSRVRNGRVVDTDAVVTVERDTAELFVSAAAEGGRVHMSLEQAESGGEVRKAGTVREVLLALMQANPNRYVTREQLERSLGRTVSRAALSKAARELRGEHPIVAWKLGGYALAKVAQARNSKTCSSCTRALDVRVHDGGSEAFCTLLNQEIEKPERRWCVGHGLEDK